MENKHETLAGNRLDFELVNVPVAFVNGLRRIMLSEIPAVVVRDVQILDNTSQVIHEMLRHRIEMLPINVRPDEAAIIRDTTLELRFLGSDQPKLITADDVVIAGPRKVVILKDRDLGTPHLIMNIKAKESVHIRATVGIAQTGSSQVCVSTFKNHIDDEMRKLNRDTYILEGGDVRVFDNHYYQRSYVRDEQGRPIHFDVAVESIGVLPAKEIVRQALVILRDKITEWVKNDILREDGGWFRVETDREGHTIGALAQAMIYSGGLAEFVSYEIPHPLLPKMVVRFQTKLDPTTVIERFKAEAVALCESILKSV